MFFFGNLGSSASTIIIYSITKVSKKLHWESNSIFQYIIFEIAKKERKKCWLNG